jgi:peptidoglycan DL-endopeptidase CwlO
VLTAGALVLAVIAPAAAESAERPAEAGTPTPAPMVAAAPGFDPIVALSKRSPRASRARGPVTVHRIGARPAAVPLRKAAPARKAAPKPRRIELRKAPRVEPRRTVSVAPRRAVKVHRSAPAPRAGNGMAAVIAFARAQVGKGYRSGGSGPGAFDCSGFTKRAYALIGIQLPHSSSGQAARVRRISRAAARPGDLVFGPGHVGVYMGGGMMIDAGNRRTGVVYRRLYAGLSIGRFS